MNSTPRNNSRFVILSDRTLTLNKVKGKRQGVESLP